MASLAVWSDFVLNSCGSFLMIVVTSEEENPHSFVKKFETRSSEGLEGNAGDDENGAKCRNLKDCSEIVRGRHDKHLLE